MLTIYGRATSSNVQLVMWAVGELGIAHDRLDYGHIHGGTNTPEFRAMNPRGLVPVLRDGDLVVWESCAILRYLAAQYGDGGAFWPDGPKARALVDMWAEWGKNELSQSFTVPIFWPRIRTAAKDRDEAKLRQSIARFEDHLDLLEAQLEGRDYVTGPDLSAADIVIGHLLFRWFDMDIKRRTRPGVRAYYLRLAERPAYQKHIMVSYDILRAEGT